MAQNTNTNPDNSKVLEDFSRLPQQDQLAVVFKELLSFKTDHEQYRKEQELFRNELNETMSNMTLEMNNISATLITQGEDITGLKNDLAATNAACESHEKDLANVEKFKIRSDMRIKVLEGKLKRQDMVIADMQKQLSAISAKQMSKNVMITQIAENENETEIQTRAKVIDFMKEKMSMTENDIEKIKFDQVYRIGLKGAKPRRIIARMSEDTVPKNLFQFRKNINFKENQMFQQFPPDIVEKRTVLQKAMTDELPNIPEAEKRLVGDKLIVQGKVYIPSIYQKSSAPVPYDEAKVKWENVNPALAVTDTVTDRGNVFQAYASKVSKQEEIQVLKDYIMAEQRSDPPTHLTMAYRLKSGTTDSVIKYFDDDREYGAGRRVLQQLTDSNTTDVVIFVARWFSGVELGPARFTHYQKAAKTVLQIVLHG